MRLSYRLLRALITLVGRLCFRFRAEGTEAVPVEGPCLLLAHHASFLDPPLIAAPIPREIHFLARTGVARAPVLAPIFSHFNVHPIRRGGVDRQAIAVCAGLLREGYPLLLFPEGTRSPDGKVHPPRGGFAMILELAPLTPCVPVLIEGSYRALPRGRWVPRPARVRVVYGPAFTLSDRAPDEDRRAFYNRCAGELWRRWRAMGASVAEE